ncbi:MAG TPA: hypothetical protein VMV75_05685 [Sulfuricella sp.]|nr:hypothetical protein [Sulfuricella sp.]
MMKQSRTLFIGAAVALVFAAAPAFAHEDHSHGAADHANLMDERKALKLEPSERAMLLIEMRQFLNGIQVMTESLSRDDLNAVASAAKPLGRAAMHDVPDSMKAKLPKEFKQFASAVHGGFDQVALDAESLGDTKHTQKQLADILKNCVSCHNAFQIQALPEKKQ